MYVLLDFLFVFDHRYHNLNRRADDLNFNLDFGSSCSPLLGLLSSFIFDSVPLLDASVLLIVDIAHGFYFFLH